MPGADGLELVRRMRTTSPEVPVVILTAKGLAGYMTTARGENLAFALYINNVPLPDLDAITPVVGQAIGEIAAAAYDAQW